VDPENSSSSRQRVLLVGDDCVSKDIAAKLQRARIITVRVQDAIAGLGAVAAVRFDLVVFDAEGMRIREIQALHEAFGRCGARAIAVLCAAGAVRPDRPWTQFEKPLSFQAIQSALAGR
jgi:hypothetical protein